MTGSFEKAFIERYELPEHTILFVEVSGGGQVQIGDYTWDTEEQKITIVASAKQEQDWPTTILTKEYDSLPAVWDDLMREPT